MFAKYCKKEIRLMTCSILKEINLKEINGSKIIPWDSNGLRIIRTIEWLILTNLHPYSEYMRNKLDYKYYTSYNSK